MPHPLDSLHGAALSGALDDPARLRAVERAGLLGPAPMHRARRWAERARRALGTPVAAMSVIGSDEQVFHAVLGIEGIQPGARVPRTASMCQYVVAHGDAVAVRDASAVDALASSSVVRTLGLRAYLGVPVTVEGHHLGALCVAAPSPRTWSDEDVARLVDLADGLSAEIALRTAREDLRRRESLLAAAVAELETMRDGGTAGGAQEVEHPHASERRWAGARRAADGPADPRSKRLQTALGSALADGGLHLVAQPVVCCETGELHAVETLLRWTDVELGPVGPDEFVPLAERSGAIDAIGRWVVEEACRAMAQLASEIPKHVRLAVNVSPRQLLHPAFAEAVGKALVAHGVAPERLVLEITETALLGHDVATERTLAQLRAIGVTLVLDDFGTGFSSLSMLKERPIDGVKIDRSFVHGLPGDETSAAIVSGVIAMARALGRTVTAEGIETPEQLTHLCDLGCDYAQGYFLGRPAPFGALASWSAPSPSAWAQTTRA